ncbi:hypothetical protein FR943_08880 [Mycobacterium sp. TNTM28]|uniref:Secreted protein n=1 Tax=[Mycobacterium] fortunisiensis TaxID=2600579 RepID=A0ABS6KKE2_9MYCO|nr:hypothetical protein [[Mycobacterium] fortunisiensis]MBU9763954.1 hypothetical protein [[Mycobacterium] fortunisiensis]
MTARRTPRDAIIAGVLIVVSCLGAGLLPGSSPSVPVAVCGPVGGGWDVSGCADPLFELDGELIPPRIPGAPSVRLAPEPPRSGVNVCTGIGRRAFIGSCF